MHTQNTPPPALHNRGIRSALLAMAAAALSLTCAVWQTQAAHADTITVTTTIDEVESNLECSLREAVQAANTDIAVGGCAPGNGADLIIVPAGTFTLTIAGENEDAALTGDLDITDTLVISGAGAAHTIIDAHGIDRGIHSLNAGYTVTLAGLTIQHGSAGWGGAALFSSNAVISDMAFVSNTATYGTGGAEFLSDGTVSHSSFTENVSSDGNAGGAAFRGRAMLDHVLFISNTTRYGAGGAVFYGADAILVDSQFIGNVSQEFPGTSCVTLRAVVCLQAPAAKAIDVPFPIASAGGALFLTDAVITRSVFISNASPATGGAGFYGSAAVTDSSFQRNASTGGIVNSEEGISQVGGAFFVSTSAVSGSDFTENRAFVIVGGATFLYTTTIANTTFHSNTAFYAIGGALFGSSATLTETHFTSNTAGMGVGGAYFVPFQGQFDNPVTLIDSSFVGNATTGEGAIPVASAAKSILATALNKRSAASDSEESLAGGAFFLSPVHAIRTTFADNTSAGVGGALFAGSTVLVDSVITGNHGTGINENHFDARGGGAMFAGAAIVSGTVFERNSAMTDGGGAHFAQSADISNSRFISNSTSSGLGGGAWFGVTTTVRSTQFEQNAATGDGGGAYFHEAAEISDSAFLSNTAKFSSGGGAHFRQASVIQRVQFAGNVSGQDGGGAYLTGLALVTDTVFSHNAAQDGSGGGAFFRGISTITGSAFDGNSGPAGTGGGAVFHYTATLLSTTFTSNTARSTGGALFAYGADLTYSAFVSNTATAIGAGGASFESTAFIANGRFVGNTTAASGGGASFGSGATVSHTVFLNNHAAADGGGVSIDSESLWWWATGYARGTVRMVNSLFGGNSAGDNGAAIYVHDTGALHLLHVTIASPDVQPNQAIAVHADTVYLTNTLIASHTIGIQRSAGAVHEDYTLFSGVETPREGTMAVGAHSRTGNAAFVDPAAGNYHLTARSDAINGGATTEVENDFDGQLRKQGHGRGSDIGFDEFLQWIQILTMVWKN